MKRDVSTTLDMTGRALGMTEGERSLDKLEMTIRRGG
jgi:hypothetical protein